MRIITVAYGAGADATSLRLISQATGGLAYVSRDPRGHPARVHRRHHEAPDELVNLG